MVIFYTLLALFFILGSYIEYRLTRKDNDYCSLRDFRTSIQLMLPGLLLDLFIKAFVIYLFIHLSRYSIFKVGYQWLAWIICYYTWDLIFYLKHCLEHNVRFMWAIHVNHHSSANMSLSTSLRSGVLKSIYRYFFWAIHLLHRSCNENNLNKNFGETFLIRDKLFGTFKEHKEARIFLFLLHKIVYPSRQGTPLLINKPINFPESVSLEKKPESDSTGIEQCDAAP